MSELTVINYVGAQRGGEGWLHTYICTSTEKLPVNAVCPPAGWAQDRAELKEARMALYSALEEVQKMILSDEPRLAAAFAGKMLEAYYDPDLCVR